ncbi:outer membrane lipoprotein LolA [Roseivivax marinus]|uniref:Outer membrane lipoprotein LolA n=1 Tax=Roseivivax marinus TaxID=1379903 RepID=W4HGU0_9RHOB|nr:outer membrane lipoprotein carrier protein LolA [Roseivivax marinus]ETW11361.1 outer membrane lipoprotein LolA [Roseivivax marinus]UMA64171.1 outer membrane lipoprotein carrier protein LolA [Roseivivax marinus]
MRVAQTLAAAALAALTALPASAAQLSLGQVSNYLNQLSSATSGFTQVNGDGTISKGTVYMQRPGKVRFEYDPPEEALVMANNGTVVIFDRKVNAAPETYPLSQTPLSIILDRNVNLGRANMVTNHTYDGTATTVTAQDPRNPQYGTIQMKFTDNPVELRQWIINDSNGSSTTVILQGLQPAQINSGKFNVRGEIARRD